MREEVGELAGHLRFLGQVDDATKASAMRSADVYCAPNTGGESFGIVLVEAMAAGTPVVASDLDAFRRVLLDGEAGRLVPVDDCDALAEALIARARRRRAAASAMSTAAPTAVRRYDWSVVANQIMRVYETVAGAGAKVQVAELMAWLIVAGHRRWSCVLLLPSSAPGRIRPPTGWTGCTSATTCPGRRSTARWAAARWWPAPSRSTPTAAVPRAERLAALADAAERAPRAGARGGARTSCRPRWRWSTRRRCRRR